MLSFSLSISFSFSLHLSVTYTCTPTRFPTTAHYSLHHLASLPSLPLSIPFFSPCTSTSIPYSRAKLAVTLKERVRDSTGQFSGVLEGPRLEWGLVQTQSLLSKLIWTPSVSMLLSVWGETFRARGKKELWRIDSLLRSVVLTSHLSRLNQWVCES